MNSFSRIQLGGWRQFSDVDVDLNSQIVVLTGENGCGKTTILNILSRHFGWDTQLVSTPFWGKQKSQQFWSDVQDARYLDFVATNPSTKVGSISYADGNVCQLNSSTFVSAQYQLQYSHQESVVGLHIPSHRPVATYNKISSVPTDPKTIQQHYQDFQQLLFQTYGEAQSYNPGRAQKSSIISLALFGYGNDAVAPNPQYRSIFEGFQEILRKILPKEIGFQKLEVRMPEVVLVTDSGDFSLDAMSGGINALFGIAWQIHMYGADKEQCTVTIDEPENHLHPSMQRRLLPSLAEAFPNYKFIVATHSPFIVTSFPESIVYGFGFQKDGRVTSLKLDSKDLAGTPNKILREVLDVPSNLPIWVEDKIKDLLSSLQEFPPGERAKRILDMLDELGMSDQISDIRID